MKVNLTAKEVIEINKMFEGNIRNDAEVETALIMTEGRSGYMQIALLWKAILVGHPYSDGNKRTAFVVTLKVLQQNNITINHRIIDVIIKEMSKISAENITDLENIERSVRYAVEGR